jgi:hypothetical protein
VATLIVSKSVASFEAARLESLKEKRDRRKNNQPPGPRPVIPLYPWSYLLVLNWPCAQRCGHPSLFHKIFVSEAKPRERDFDVCVCVCRERFKHFRDLKGSRFAFNDEMSLSGNVAMMTELKKNGYGVHFFGDKIKSGKA